MTARPILFSAPMVRALLAGTKTQTRRVAGGLDCICGHPVGDHAIHRGYTALGACGKFSLTTACPYGQPGDRLWVRETWAGRTDIDWRKNPGKALHYAMYAADGKGSPSDPMNWHDYGGKWKSGRFMPQAVARIFLELTDVRVQRVQEISEEDAKAEGIDRDKWGVEFYAPGVVYTNCYGDKVPGVKPYHKAAEAYRDLWDEINAKRGFGWDENPWVWAITFKMLEDARQAGRGD